MMASEVRTVRVVPDFISAETYFLSPNDLYDGIEIIALCWPVFFNYDIDGDRLMDALKKFLVKYPMLCGRVRSHEDMRYVIEVDPTNDEKHGVPFSEWKSDLSIADIALNHSQAKAESAQFPIMPVTPFFTEICDRDAVNRGDEPLMKVKLTHCCDGCILSICIRHVVMDAERYIEAYRDISRAYRGEEVPDRDHDRSYLWPDRIAEHYDFLGDEIHNLPRKVSKEAMPLDYISFPDESSKNYALFLSNDDLKNLKEHVQPFLKEGEFVSTNDVIVSFCWMLSSELNVKAENVASGGDIDIDNTFVTVAVELLKNNITLVPENYSGNALLGMPIVNQGQELNQASLKEVFAKLALTMRKTLNIVKEQPAVAAQGILFYYNALATGQFTTPIPMDRLRGIYTNSLKTPVEEIDFGEGPPVHLLMLHIPHFHEVCGIGPGFGFDGVIVQATLLGDQAVTLKDSVIIKELAPGIRDVYSDFTLEGLKKRMKVAE